MIVAVKGKEGLVKEDLVVFFSLLTLKLPSLVAGGMAGNPSSPTR